MAGAISVAVLAGGKSSRMGQDKAFVRVGGLPLIERVIGRVQSLGDELFVIANNERAFAYLDVPVFPDLITGKGSLGGLYTALTHSRSEHTLVVSCDQPFLNPALLRYLIKLRAGYDVVVSLNREGYPQSMQAVYSKACLIPIRRQLDAGWLKVIGFYPEVRVREVSGEEIDRFDPDRRSFLNLNTPEDLAEAQRLAELFD